MKGRSFVKRLFSSVLIFTVFISCVSLEITRANAQGSVTFSLEGYDAKEGRLFTVLLNAQGGCTDFSACRITIDYDNSKIAFRELSIEDSESELEHTVKDGRITLVFLSKNGIDITKKKCIAAITFKAENSGTAPITVSADQCIDNSANDLAVGSISGVDIEISSGSNTSYEPEKSDNSLENATNSEATSQSDANNIIASNIDNKELVLPRDNSYMMFLAGVGVATVLFGVFALAFYIGMKYKEKKLKTFENGKKAEENKQDNKQE